MINVHQNILLLGQCLKSDRIALYYRKALSMRLEIFESIYNYFKTVLKSYSLRVNKKNMYLNLQKKIKELK